MKKKLITLLVLSYVGGSFSGEPSSPFGPNPFASPAESNSVNSTTASAAPVASNPFAVPASASSEPSPSSSSPTNPFGAALSANPFAMHKESSAMHAVGPAPQQSAQENNKNVTDEHHQVLSEQHQPVAHHALSEIVSGKNPDTGEDAVIDSEVDTFEQEGSGNWLLKRVWWEKTEAIYEQIKQVFNDIMNARMDYISQRNSLDRELDVAYGQIGLEEGELQDIIDHCLAFTKQEKKEQGFLNKKEEELYNALQHKQHDLEQIKLDMKALQAADQKIDEALDTLFQQIDVANQYEQKAWNNFKDIARELNDKIARKSYYETEGLLKDIQNVHVYITSQFSSYFTQILQTARSHSQSISSQVQVLKQAGVDLKKQANELEQANEAERLKKEVTEHDKAFEAAEKKKEVKKAAQPTGMVFGVINTVKEFFLSSADSVLHVISSTLSKIKNWFVKEESVVKARTKSLVTKVADEEKKLDAAIEERLAAIQDTVKDEERTIGREEKEDEDFATTSGHPVSVMPQEASSHQVKTFGLPPTEEVNNHPAFSHTPAQTNVSAERSVSPFKK